MRYFMTYFRILTLAALCSTGALAEPFTTHMGMQDQRVPGYDNWQGMQINEGHWGRSADQDPSQWQNFTISIPYGTRGIQVTAVDSNGAIMTQGGYNADIPTYMVDRRRSKLKLSVVWWGAPWTFFIGYKSPGNNNNEL
jgi:hypothetical protein